MLYRTDSEKLVIDTDAGGDDAFAIAFVLSVARNMSGLDVIAITCVYGNTVVENVEINVLKTLTIINKTEVRLKKKKMIYTRKLISFIVFFFKLRSRYTLEHIGL